MENLCTETQTIAFPKLYNQNANEKMRQWQILIKLVKPGTDNQIPFRTEYVDTFPQYIDAVYWTETGILNGKLMKSEVTIAIPTNVGKKNFRNPLQQAIFTAESKIRQKKREGFAEITETKSSELWFPMLAMNYDDHKRCVRFPCYVQPKLDGLRCIITQIQEQPIAYTRTRKEYSQENQIISKIISDVLPGLKKLSSIFGEIFLDGELYSSDLKLQELNHYTRRITSDEDPMIQFHIFDMIIPSKLSDITFHDRTNILKECIKPTQRIHLVPTFLCSSEKEIEDRYKTFLDERYEGAMIRSLDGLYASSSGSKSKLRTKDLLKYKPVYTTEYPIIGYTSGTNGKEKESVIWICENEEKITFKVTPNDSYSNRKKLLEECMSKFSEKYKYRLLSVEYRGKSKDNIPLHCKGLYIRDIE